MAKRARRLESLPLWLMRGALAAAILTLPLHLTFLLLLQP